MLSWSAVTSSGLVWLRSTLNLRMCDYCDSCGGIGGKINYFCIWSAGTTVYCLLRILKDL